MTFGPLRSLVLELNQAVHGVAATVTRPAPDNTPIVTTAIWQTTAPLDEDRAYGTDFQRRQPRRILAIPRSAVATMPRGTVIVAPGQPGGADETWHVDGLEPVQADTWRVIVKQA